MSITSLIPDPNRLIAAKMPHNQNIAIAYGPDVGNVAFK